MGVVIKKRKTSARLMNFVQKKRTGFEIHGEGKIGTGRGEATRSKSKVGGWGVSFRFFPVPFSLVAELDPAHLSLFLRIIDIDFDLSFFGRVVK